MWCHDDDAKSGTQRFRVAAIVMVQTMIPQWLEMVGEMPWWYCWWKKSCTSWQVVYPIISSVLYIPRGAELLPSTGLGFLASSWSTSYIAEDWMPVLYISHIIHGYVFTFGLREKQDERKQQWTNHCWSSQVACSVDFGGNLGEFHEKSWILWSVGLVFIRYTLEHWHGTHWNPKMKLWKMIFPFKHLTFRFHVDFFGV